MKNLSVRTQSVFIYFHNDISRMTYENMKKTKQFSEKTISEVINHIKTIKHEN